MAPYEARLLRRHPPLPGFYLARGGHQTWLATAGVPLFRETAMPEPTYWNGKPCPCRRLRVRLPDSYDGPATRPWFEHLLGQEIDTDEWARDIRKKLGRS